MNKNLPKTLEETNASLCASLIHGIIQKADVNEKQIGKLCGIKVRIVRSLYRGVTKKPKVLYLKRLMILYSLDTFDPGNISSSIN